MKKIFNILVLFSLINLKAEEVINSHELPESSTQAINRCANCHQCQNNNNSNNNTNLNQADPTPAIVLTNFAQMAVHFGNIVVDPKNKPVVQQNVCNIMACVANAAAQAFRNLNLQNCDNTQETSEKIYRYLLSLDIDKSF